VGATISILSLKSPVVNVRILMVAEHIAWVEENFWGLKNKLKESPHSMVYGTMFTYTTYHLEYIPKYL